MDILESTRTSDKMEGKRRCIPTCLAYFVQVNFSFIHNLMCCPEDPNSIWLRYAMVFMLLETSYYVGKSDKNVTKER